MDNLYILDTSQGCDIACHSYIVGKDFSIRMKNCADEMIKVFSYIAGLSQLKDSIIFCQILRACMGYEFSKKNKKTEYNIKDIWIRPVYMNRSYRDHLSESSNIIIAFEDFSLLPKNSNITLVIQDTIASGNTLIAVLNRVIDYCKLYNISISTLYLYGYFSEYGLKIISSLLKRNKIKVYAFSIGNISDLSYNMYDMPIYGIDKSFYEIFNKIKNIGCIIDKSTLERYILHYFPGCDQPGDFSDRQDTLLTNSNNKLIYEKGNVIQHLNNSCKFLKEICEISKNQEWYKEYHNNIYKNEMSELIKMKNIYERNK